MNDETTTTDQAYERKVMDDETLAAIRVAEIRDQEGWDDDTMLSLAETFITAHGLAGKFANYVETTQRAEQATRSQADDPGPEGMYQDRGVWRLLEQG